MEGVASVCWNSKDERRKILWKTVERNILSPSDCNYRQQTSQKNDLNWKTVKLASCSTCPTWARRFGCELLALTGMAVGADILSARTISGSFQLWTFLSLSLWMLDNAKSVLPSPIWCDIWERNHFLFFLSRILDFKEEKKIRKKY